MQVPEETLTVPEVAKMLRLSRQTIYNFVRDGKLPHFNVGTKVRFRRADIESMMQPKATTQTQGETNE